MVLYLSGSFGVSSININKTADKGENVKLVVPFLEIDDEMIYLVEGEDITIPADCKRITIYGYALTYALQNPRLNYDLEDFDEEVTSVSRHELQPVSYTNLDSGEYVFHLSVIDIMTGEETNSISVKFVKAMAFYEQIWFWIIVNAVIILKEIETSPELSLGAGFHHERMDGRGYPFGKDGDEIPDVAQIIAVAELKRVAGTQLNENMNRYC